MSDIIELEKYKLMIEKQREANIRWKQNNKDKVKEHNDKYNAKANDKYKTDENFKQQKKDASKRHYQKMKLQKQNNECALVQLLL